MRGGNNVYIVFESGGRELSNKKIQLGNGVLFRNKRCLERTRTIIKEIFN